MCTVKISKSAIAKLQRQSNELCLQYTYIVLSTSLRDKSGEGGNNREGRGSKGRVMGTGIWYGRAKTMEERGQHKLLPWDRSSRQ